MTRSPAKDREIRRLRVKNNRFPIVASFAPKPIYKSFDDSLLSNLRFEHPTVKENDVRQSTLIGVNCRFRFARALWLNMLGKKVCQMCRYRGVLCVGQTKLAKARLSALRLLGEGDWRQEAVEEK